MSNTVYDVYDDFVESHVAEYIDDQVQKAKWKYGFRSNPHHGTKHWNVRCGSTEEEVTENGCDFVLPIWNAAINKYKFDEKYGVKAFACSAQQRGITWELMNEEIREKQGELASKTPEEIEAERKAREEHEAKLEKKNVNLQENRSSKFKTKKMLLSLLHLN